jgi:hypothetical protein
MARRNSPSPLLIVLIALVLITIFLLRQGSRPPSSIRRSAPFAEPSRSPRRYPERKGEAHERRPAGETCSALGVSCGSEYFSDWNEPGNANCHAAIHNGYPEPDPHCTPGGVNPSVTEEVLRDPSWRTGCVRNCESGEGQKHIVYAWYGLPRPEHNNGQSQICELDHLVPLELGGADGLGNIWPQCGPDRVTLDNRYFKVKDRVENYLADRVRSGRMPLDEAQRGIAENWTQYLNEANEYCAHGRC